MLQRVRLNEIWVEALFEHLGRLILSVFINIFQIQVFQLHFRLDQVPFFWIDLDEKQGSRLKIKWVYLPNLPCHARTEIFQPLQLIFLKNFIDTYTDDIGLVATTGLG